MSSSVWLRLGRVSNLPTVWTNVLAALALSGALGGSAGAGGAAVFSALLLSAVLSLFYVGGMYLNDAFDRRVDALERPTRPIPSGQVSARAVFAFGFGALFAGTLLLGLSARARGAPLAGALASGAALSALIVAYDVYHKQNPLSPLLMGACRVMIYVAVAYALGRAPSATLLMGAFALWCHLIGLTYAAKQEAFNRLERLWPLLFLALPIAYGAVLGFSRPLSWAFVLGHAGWGVYALSFLRPGPRRSVPAAVVRLIAGISLLDALLIAGAGAPGWALLAALGCALTRVLQRYVPGT